MGPLHKCFYYLFLIILPGLILSFIYQGIIFSIQYTASTSEQAAIHIASFERFIIEIWRFISLSSVIAWVFLALWLIACGISIFIGEAFHWLDGDPRTMTTVSIIVLMTSGLILLSVFAAGWTPIIMTIAITSILGFSCNLHRPWWIWFTPFAILMIIVLLLMFTAGWVENSLDSIEQIKRVQWLIGWMTQFSSIVVTALVVGFNNLGDHVLRNLSVAMILASSLVWWGFMIGGGFTLMI
jgi:hypothetical protein